LEEFYHEIYDPIDYNDRQIAEVSNLIRSNIQTLRTIKLAFKKIIHQAPHFNIIKTWIEAIDSA